MKKIKRMTLTIRTERLVVMRRRNYYGLCERCGDEVRLLTNEASCLLQLPEPFKTKTETMKGEPTMAKQLRRSIMLVSAALLIAITLSLPSVKADPTRLPPGTYATTISETDVPPSFPPEVIALLVGEWQIEFTEGGTYIVTKDGEIAVVGRYTSNPSRLVMTDLQGAYACTDSPGIATGVYRWNAENNQLILSAVLDRCSGRHVALTSHALQRQ